MSGKHKARKKTKWRCCNVLLSRSGGGADSLAARPCAKGEGQTNIVEAINCFLPQHCGMLVCKSRSFSKSLAMHTARIKVVIDKYNRNIILD